MQLSCTGVCSQSAIIGHEEQYSVVGEVVFVQIVHQVAEAFVHAFNQGGICLLYTSYIAAFQVHNPAIFDKSIKEIGGLNYPKFVISRLWRDGNVSIPTSEKIIREGDRLLVVTSEKYAPALTVLFGEQEHTDWNKEDIDWNAIDSQDVYKRQILIWTKAMCISTITAIITNAGSV